MSGQYRRSNVHIFSANATDTRYVVPHTMQDGRPAIQVRTNDPMSRDITSDVTVTHLSAREVAITFSEPPGDHTFIVGVTADYD